MENGNGQEIGNHSNGPWDIKKVKHWNDRLRLTLPLACCHLVQNLASYCKLKYLSPVLQIWLWMR